MYGWYGVLRDELTEEDIGWDIQGPDGDPMADCGTTGPRREQQSRQHREEEEYMEGVRRRVLRPAYVEEPCRSRVRRGE